MASEWLRLKFDNEGLVDASWNVTKHDARPWHPFSARMQEVVIVSYFYVRVLRSMPQAAEWSGLTLSPR